MKKILSVITAAVIFLTAYIWFPGAGELQDGEIIQSDSIEISNSEIYQHDIFYPERFSSLPRLQVKLIKGSGYLDIVEQRADGFVFKTSNLGYSEAEGAHVEWTARGFLGNR